MTGQCSKPSTFLQDVHDRTVALICEVIDGWMAEGFNFDDKFYAHDLNRIAEEILDTLQRNGGV